MPPKHNKDLLLCIVFFGIAISRAQTQEPNFDFISPDLSSGKPVVCIYNGVCQSLYQEDPQRKDHLQRKLRSSRFTRQELSKMENEWARLKKNNNPFKFQNQDLSEMENEWARLNKNSNPLKNQKQDLSEIENEWAQLKKNNNLLKVQHQHLSTMENEWARLKTARPTGITNEARDCFMPFRIRL